MLNKKKMINFCFQSSYLMNKKNLLK